MLHYFFTSPPNNNVERSKYTVDQNLYRARGGEQNILQVNDFWECLRELTLDNFKEVLNTI